MIKVKELGIVFKGGKDRKIALWKCSKCLTEKEGRSDMKQTTELCKKCMHKTHGKEGTKVYNIWLTMKSRCYSRGNNRYSSHGGRGITVCQEWLNAETFIAWAEANGFKASEDERNTEYTLDRIDNDKGYEPSNCRIVPLSVQEWNKQILMSTNTSGYRGVNKKVNRWVTTVPLKGKIIFRASCKTAKEAAARREKFILENNLPHIKNDISVEEIAQILNNL